MAGTTARLKVLGIKPWIQQSAGKFLWCRLPDGIDATEVTHRALAANVVLAPGNAFSLSHTASSFLRFDVAQCADERVFRVLKTALR